jgi:hypothetical protein
VVVLENQRYVLAVSENYRVIDGKTIPVRLNHCPHLLHSKNTNIIGPAFMIFCKRALSSSLHIKRRSIMNVSQAVTYYLKYHRTNSKKKYY